MRFKNEDHNIITATTNLGTNKTPSQVTFAGIEKFLCQIYQLHTSISKVSDLCWWMFKKRQEQSERLPPTPDVLQAIHDIISCWYGTVTLLPIPISHHLMAMDGN